MKTIFLCLIFTLLPGCNFKMWGTNTGNPDAGSPPDSPGSPGVPIVAVVYLENIICEKIKTCYSGADVPSCVLQIHTTNLYTSELGTTASVYPTMRDLQAAEQNHTLNPNTANLQGCQAAIEGLGCGDSLIQNAYSSGSPSDYSTTKIIFGASSYCANVF